MNTKDTLDSVKDEADQADASGGLIELDAAMLDQIGGGKNNPWAI